MSNSDFSRATLANNPAWAQLLGLCPLLAVSNTVANATGLALASAFVVVGANTSISLLRRIIPDEARLPCFVLIIATFTTLTVMVLEAYAFDLYSRIALFVQIIVTNCMILGRTEVFASRQPVGRAVMDAMGTALGFAIALLTLGAIREALGKGTLTWAPHVSYDEDSGKFYIYYSKCLNLYVASSSSPTGPFGDEKF